MVSTTTQPVEVWMILKDRQLLARLMATQRLTNRALARASGFQSHSYVNRLLAGDARSCKPERAVAICAVLGVPLDILFVSRVSSVDGRNSKRDATRPPQPTPRRRNAA